MCIRDSLPFLLETKLFVAGLSAICCHDTVTGSDPPSAIDVNAFCCSYHATGEGVPVIIPTSPNTDDEIPNLVFPLFVLNSN